MNPMVTGRVLKLAAAAALTVSLAACQPVQNQPEFQGGNQTQNGTAEIDPGKRTLTVVEGSEKQQSEAVSVQRIHRLEGASIESWLSDDELAIMTTRIVKEATATEEAEFTYTTSVVKLTEGDKQEEVNGSEKTDLTTVKEQVSPDGRYSFIQQWADQYTARNYMKNRETGTMTEIEAANYMELGGWLDAGHYILAAGSTSGRGDILQIGTDGGISRLELNDPEVEFFSQFGVSQGSIYYIDGQDTLKTFTPEQGKPETVSERVTQFDISPDGGHIVAVTYPSTRSTSELRLIGTDGKVEGGALAEGNLLPYVAWSPDSSKLALAVYNEDKNGLNGVYIFDYESGQLSLVGPDYFPQYPLSWSPSGTRLGVTVGGPDSLPVTQILDFNL